MAVANGLHRDVDQRLRLLANGTSDAIYAYWRAERASHMAPGNWDAAPPPTLSAVVDAGAFPNLLTRWMTKTGALSRDRFRVLSRTGTIIATSPWFNDLQPAVSPTTLSALQAGRIRYETVPMAASTRVRIVTQPVRVDDKIRYALQVAAPLDAVDAALADLRMRLVLTVPLALLLTSLVGWWLAVWALRPVGHMIRQVEHLSTGRLHERLDVPQTGDEIQRLAQTFNAMLERVETGLRRVRQFSAAATHELRTPLTALRGELEVTLRHPRTVEEYQALLRVQMDALEDMSLTVEELLALARSEATVDSIDRHPVDCRGLAMQSATVWEDLGRKKQVAVSVQAPHAVWVAGEYRLLERLVMNLLDNAVRHTPPGGRVTLTVTGHGGHARLAVTDTGVGIAAEDVPHLFDRFFKPRALMSDGQSTGLGLGLCRWIAEAHHGRIEVASAPGAGTTFSVWLPLVSPPVLTDTRSVPIPFPLSPFTRA